MAGLRNIDLRRHLPSTTFVALALLILAGLVSIAVYLGLYNIAADAPHYRSTYLFIENLRDQSIAARARSIAVPKDLADPRRISAGAGLYTEMCSGCHLAPGMAKTEISQGLYPHAPELSRPSDHTPAQQFWIIKHGVKMTAMPAWGKTHDDKLIWDMVAFVQKLPKLTPAQYQEMTKSAPMDHDAMMQNMSDPQNAQRDESSPHSHADGGH